MARLAAIEKALYFSSPERVMHLIARAVTFAHPPLSRPRLLDVCAGEGTAAKILADAWGMDAYGVELDGGRAAEASRKLKVCLNGSYHQLEATKGAFHVLFLNPPYDDGENDGVTSRQEIQFLMDATQYLTAGGLLIFVPPRHILRSEAFRQWMQRHYDGICAWEFPEPEVKAFDQVVVIAKRSSNSWSYSLMDALKDPSNLPVLGQSQYRSSHLDRYYWPNNAPDMVTFELDPLDPTTIAPSPFGPNPTGAFSTSQWDMLVGGKGNHNDQPLVVPRPGHQAMLLAAGALDGAALGDGKIVKGGSEKVTATIVGEPDDKGVVETIERERIVSRLAVLDLKTGDYESWTVDQEPDKTAEWFRAHGEELARAIIETHTPAFDGDLTPYKGTLARLSAPGILPGHSKPEILPIQQQTAAAVAFRWLKQGRKTTIISGEMGVGKSLVAIIACEITKQDKVVVVCPSHLVPKWIRECEKATGIKGIAVTAKRLTDVDAFFAQDEGVASDGDDLSALLKHKPKTEPRYLILSKETAKLGCRWEPKFTTRTIMVTKEVVDRDADTYSYWSSWGSRHYNPPTKKIKIKEQIVTCPDCGRSQEREDGAVISVGEMGDKVRAVCSHQDCQAPLWQVTPLTGKGTMRWPLAEYLSQRYPRRYSLVIDEAHGFAKADSDQSRAVQDLCSGARKILAMTGTLYGGRASSIFHLLYKVEPSFRQAYQYNECDRFVSHHGLFETKYEEQERYSTYGYKRGGKRTGGKVKEIPGMSPAMIPVLLPYTIFLKLKDLRLELPPYTEEVELIDHDPDVRRAAVKLQGDVKDVIREHPEVLGQYLMACLGYPDCPEHAESIKAQTEDGELVEIASAPAFPVQAWPKDDRVAEIVASEVAQGRKCLVYFSQTHKRDARQRVKEALEAKGLKVAIMDSNVAPEKREEWLEKHFPDKGRGKGSHDVMLTNGRLVETGMDLLFASTIIQYGNEYCVTPETRVLTDDLRWVPAGDLKPGDSLLGFDEHRPAKGRQRKTQHATVVNTMRIHLPVWKFTMSDGSVLRSSADHRWLAIKNESHMGYDWMDTATLAADVLKGAKRWIPKVISVDEPLNSYMDGYVAGMFDGEGHVSFPKTVRDGHDGRKFTLGYAQNRGGCLDSVLNQIHKHGFQTGQYPQRTGCVNVTIKGGWDEKLRFLQMFRPQRLLSNFREALCAGKFKVALKPREMTQIVNVEFEGIQEVVAMETTSKTFFAEGFASHNCIPSLRQSIRRSWRLGQDRPVRVIFLAYKGTMQQIALNLIARKMRAAEMVDGDETGGLAQFDESGANFFVELAQEAVASVQDSMRRTA